MPPAGPHTTPSPVPAEFVRYAVAIEPAEVGRGYTTGRLSADDALRLAFLRRCDLRERAGEFTRFEALEPSSPELGVLCGELAEGRADADRIWDHLDLSWSCSRADGVERDRGVRAALDRGRQEFLLDRAASGQGMNWQNVSALMGTDRPEEVDAAFDRGEELVGVAVIGLALNHPDAAEILPRVARALASSEAEPRHQGRVALAHVARLHRTVDRRCLELLRSHPRGNEADDDLWSYVPRRRLPIWLWRHHLAERVRGSNGR